MAIITAPPQQKRTHGSILGNRLKIQIFAEPAEQENDNKCRHHVNAHHNKSGFFTAELKYQGNQDGKH